MDRDEAKGPEALSEQSLDQVGGGASAVHTGGANVVLGDGSVRPGDGSVKPGITKGYEGWPC